MDLVVIGVAKWFAFYPPVSGEVYTPATSSFHTADIAYRDCYTMRVSRPGKQLTAPNLQIFADLKGVPLPLAMSAHT